MSNAEHPDLEMILGYVWNELNEEKEILLGEHFAECEKCTEIAGEYSRFRLLWENWEPAFHGRVYWENRVESLLAAARKSAEPPAVKDRLSSWLNRWKGKVGGMIQLVSEGIEARVLTRFPEGLFPSGRDYAFAHQAPVRGADPGGDSLVRVTSPSGIEVQWNRAAKNVRVKIKDNGSAPPAVVLLPASGEPMVALPERIEGTAYYAVVFERLESSECILLFEPSGDQD